jgi:hypothetical protein
MKSSFHSLIPSFTTALLILVAVSSQSFNCLQRLSQLLCQLALHPCYIASGRIQQKTPFSSLQHKNISSVAWLFVAAETCLRSRCLAMNVYSGFQASCHNILPPIAYSYDLSHDNIYKLHKQLNRHFNKSRYIEPFVEFRQENSGYGRFWEHLRLGEWPRGTWVLWRSCLSWFILQVFRSHCRARNKQDLLALHWMLLGSVCWVSQVRKFGA